MYEIGKGEEEEEASFDSVGVVVVVVVVESGIETMIPDPSSMGNACAIWSPVTKKACQLAGFMRDCGYARSEFFVCES